MNRSYLGLSFLSLAIFLSSPASGQDFSKAEVFGGYSYLHVDTQGLSTSSLNNECNIVFGGTCPITFGIHRGFNGWNFGAQDNVNKWFGRKAQVAGQYGNIISFRLNPPLPTIPFAIPGQHIYDVLFGPVISHRTRSYTAFAHAMAGLQHVGLSGSISGGGLGFSGPSETNFAFALGGGLDVKASRHFAIRVGQFDYEFVNSSGAGHQNDYRFSAGVVFGLGGKP